MPEFNYDEYSKKKKESKYPKSESEKLGTVKVTLEEIKVIPVNEKGFHKIYLTYKDEDGKLIATEFSPPSLARYTTTDKEGNLKRNINPKLDTSTSLFHEDLWLNPHFFCGMGYENNNYYYAVENNNKIINVPRYGILFAIERMIVESTQTWKGANDSNLFGMFKSNYKFPKELLIPVTAKNIGQFGYKRTADKLNDVYGTYPADTTTETRISKAGKEYTVTVLADKSPAYLEVVNTNTIDFTSKYVKNGDVWSKVSPTETGYPAGFYAYFTMLSEYLAKNKDKTMTPVNIFVTGEVESFEKNGETIRFDKLVVGYGSTARRWFDIQKYDNFKEVVILRDKQVVEKKPFMLNRVAEKHEEYLKFKNLVSSSYNELPQDNNAEDLSDLDEMFY